jgi:Tfp pilus assembly protein PilO
MTGRDRIVAIALGMLAVLAAAWMLVVSPERKQAGELDTQVSAAQTQLTSTEGQLANARSAQAQYTSAYAAVVSLGKAVPPSQEVPSLIFQLAQASNHKSVEFASIVSGSGPSSSSGAASATSTTAAGFTPMPFTFVFNGSFFDLEHLFEGLSRFTLRKTSGGLEVSGRLLTIQSIKLSPLANNSTETPTGAASTLNGTITATAYVLPASQGLTGGATAASPAASPRTASTTGAPSSPTAPAIARVIP